jgi:hypothetical protein
LAKAISDLTAAKAGLTAARDGYSEAVLKFIEESGYRHDTLTEEQFKEVESSSVLAASLRAIEEYYTAIPKYQNQVLLSTQDKEKYE